LLERGDEAPRVEATAHTGQAVKLSDFKGKPVVVYFYPKDDTPGCTVEAQGFRDDHAELTKAGIVVIGVSTDDTASHRAFASKYELPFLLLPDTDQKISKAFGVPITNGHSKRVTFVIDKNGKIAKVFPEVTPAGHAQEVLTAVKSLDG
jgi:peroxiredoxin Q/BCP